jgi:ABC-type multidrug transport system fused ATPase/permease subunit
MTVSPLKKVWALLDAQERRNALKVLAVTVVGAFASAVMVGSVYPFLAVLSNPGLIEDVPALAWAFETGGFTSDYGFMFALGLGAIGIIIVSNVFLIIQTWAVTRYTQMRVHSISRRLLEKYLAQPYEYFLGRHSGDMSTTLLAEAQQVVGQFLRPMAEAISASLTVTAVATTLLLADPLVATVSIGLFALTYATITILTRRYLRVLGITRAAANVERFRISGEALNGIKDIKLLGREHIYLDRFSASSIRMAQSQVGVGVLSQVPRFIILCLVLLDPEGLQEREALGSILPLIGLLAFAGQRLMPELQKLYQSIVQMTAGLAALERVYEDLHGGTDTKLDRTQPTPLGLRDALELASVSYSYPNTEVAGIRDVSLKIRAGEHIGIVGASGAGKTTLADVVLGLLIPQVGTLRADGVDITSETLRAWQQSVGYVQQDIFLTDASLAENIALGMNHDELDPLKIEHCARVAQLHEFVENELANGYQTVIGERGVRLSGGQRQRIGIARALYHDANLIVFDEATSALDNLTEREVMEAIEALPDDKTILIIAHRFSTVRHCDRILVLKQGRAAAMGTWEALTRESDEFRALAGSEMAAGILVK